MSINGSLREINNLLYIDEISLERCLEILKERFNDRRIYTQLGAVLLSINPYQYTHSLAFYQFVFYSYLHISFQFNCSIVNACISYG